MRLEGLCDELPKVRLTKYRNAAMAHAVSRTRITAQTFHCDMVGDVVAADL